MKCNVNVLHLRDKFQNIKKRLIDYLERDLVSLNRLNARISITKKRQRQRYPKRIYYHHTYSMLRDTDKWDFVAILLTCL